MAPGQTVGEAVRGYLAHLVVERGLAGNTVESYRRDLRRYESVLAARGRTTLGEVTAADVAEFLAVMREGDDPATLTHEAMRDNFVIYGSPATVARSARSFARSQPPRAAITISPSSAASSAGASSASRLAGYTAISVRQRLRSSRNHFCGPLSNS